MVGIGVLHTSQTSRLSTHLSLSAISAPILRTILSCGLCCWVKRRKWKLPGMDGYCLVEKGAVDVIEHRSSSPGIVHLSRQDVVLDSEQQFWGCNGR